MSVEAALGLMIGFATLVVTIIFGILALVLA
ncbi:putative holin-like toxin [Enterococcus faecalis]|nr:putative holin-like toxin [Enterococcus faecalis]